MDDERIKELEKKRTPCEVYSRVVGYIRPTNQWNEGKQEEFQDRTVFDGALKNKENYKYSIKQEKSV